MQDKAYSKGSACPGFEPGKMRIYSMRFCPYAQRVLLVAAAKEIPHEIVNINLANKPEWIYEKNSEGKVPVLEHNAKCVAESLIISDYLDEIFPNNSLTSSDPYQKALDRMLIEKFSKASSFMNSNWLLLVTGDTDKWEELFNVLENWEDEFTERGTIFLGGNKPAMIDLMIWPWFERLHSITVSYNLEPIPDSRLPGITAWISRMLLEPAVKACLQPASFMKGYYDSRRKGKPDYDFGL